MNIFVGINARESNTEINKNIKYKFINAHCTYVASSLLSEFNWRLS